jgi:glycosyltransferase involved in cell wall biosynthesis
MSSVISPEVSIVLGTYKRSHILGRTLRSLIDQSFKDVEIVVVDDNGLDNENEIESTQTIVKSFNDSRIVHVKNHVNLGHPANFRKCFDFIRGRYFMLFSDDDELAEGTLEEMVTFLRRNPTVGLVHGLDWYKYPDGSEQKMQPMHSSDCVVDPKYYVESAMYHKPDFNWSQSAVLYRSEFVKYNNLRIVSNYMWDHSFHLQYLLFCKQVGYLNRYVGIRNEEIRHTGRLSGWYLFYRDIEVPYMSLSFIDVHEPLLIAKGYPVNKYRLHNARRLWMAFIHSNDSDTGIFSLGLAMKTFLKVWPGRILWYPARGFGFAYRALAAVRHKVVR